MNGDISTSRYTAEEVQRILDINSRPNVLRSPENPFYRKSGREMGPTWAEKRDFVHYLTYESNISAVSKKYLKEQEGWVEKYQLRGLKYGMATTAATYLFFPVIRRQPFLRRFGLSMLPMAYFMRWGYVWGHENWWRRAKEVIVTYEIYVGTRSKFTTK